MRDPIGLPASAGGDHDNFPACPPWCTAEHRADDNIEIAEGYREHTVPIAELTLTDGGKATVDLIRSDRIGVRGDNQVLIVCEDVATPTTARELAAAAIYAASLAEGQVAA